MEFLYVAFSETKELKKEDLELEPDFLVLSGLSWLGLLEDTMNSDQFENFGVKSTGIEKDKVWELYPKLKQVYSTNPLKMNNPRVVHDSLKKYEKFWKILKKKFLG